MSRLSFKTFAALLIAPGARNMTTQVKPIINFNTKHLKKGDPLPAYNGKLRIYNMRYCPYAQRTILVLNAKKIDYEVINVNLKDKPEWLTQKSPLAKVPSIEVAENVIIYESLITSEYLDDVYPQRPLISKDPHRKAYDNIIIEYFSLLSSAIFKIFRAEPFDEETLSKYSKTLHFVEEQLKSRGTKFLGGNEPGFVDYMIWPWFERIIVFQKRMPEVQAETEKHKILNEYIGNMLKDPAVSQYLIPEDVNLKFIDHYVKGEPKYDFLDE